MADFERVKKFVPEIEEAEGEDQFVWPEGNIPLVQLDYYDVNYSNLDFESILQENNVPYHKMWSAGSEYAAGNEYFWVTSGGESVFKEIYEGQGNMVDLTLLVKAREGGLEALDAFIGDQQEAQYIMPWPEQQTAIKAYLLTQESVESVL